MKRVLSVVLLMLVSAAAGVCLAEDQGAVDIKIVPQEIKQGDPFMVVARGISSAPIGVALGEKLKFSSCGDKCMMHIGCAAMGQNPGKWDISVHADGKTINLALNILPGGFDIQRLTLPDRLVNLSKEDEARADREAERLKALWLIETEQKWDGRFIMPVETPISTGFGLRRIINGIEKSPHGGIDLKGKEGDPIKASNSGVVVMADELFFGGRALVIDHGMGIYTVYMHMSEFKVAVGDKVNKGDVIGLVGSTGRSTGPHLHFGVKVNSQNANPVSMANLPL